MLENIQDLLKEANEFKSTNAQEIESFRVKFLGKKGILNDLFSEFKNVPSDQKKEYGKNLNILKSTVENKVNTLKESADNGKSSKDSDEDYTKPAYPLEIGSRHPINLVKNRIIEIFNRVGFSLSEGPEIEDDWHNFTALNLPEYHPARDMQDTFFIEDKATTGRDIMLRTHTSSVQIRHMENHQPPFRILSPGRVYRNEDISARSHCFFHQIEGLYIDKGVSFADLKQIIQYFTKELFGKSEIRLRPSYFPFTEPSCEIDVYWGLETEADYRITKGTGWLEIMGGGMVDPNVLENMNIDPQEFSGYAFGMGIERIVMLLYQIEDIRMFSENDIRMLDQFKSVIS